MLSRARLTAVTVTAVLALVVLVVPTASAAAKVPKVTGLTAAGSNAASGVLGVKWKKVTGATYQVRWAQTTGKLGAAKVYSTGKTAIWSPVLPNICTTWYAQVRARKGAKLGGWSTPKALKFSVPNPKVPTPITSTQTSSSQAQVRWTRSVGAAGYRLDYSPAPFGNWPGLEHLYTPFTAPAATGASVNLPALGDTDHFLNAAYGNPIFSRLQVKRCNGTVIQSTYFPVFAKPFPAGTGDALRFGTYNVELAPTGDTPKMAALADNIATSGVDVVALQEANATTATDLIAKLGSAEGQTDWATCGKGQQQVMWRTSTWVQAEAGDCFDIGQPADVDVNAAKTPLPTPAVKLTPADGDPLRQPIIVGSVHLEDRKKFEDVTTIVKQKQDAHDAAQSLVDTINANNPQDYPVLMAGDFKGNFGGGGQPAGAGYCDKSSTPQCAHEGQPTFIRNGYLDARAAVTRVNSQYGTVNSHLGTQAAFSSGVGSRADFLVVKGFTGISRYVNVANKLYPSMGLSGDTPSDHNLVYADLFVPKV